ncbi:TlpA family protein disulfide reductase [Pedobacter helvus]|uniref:TlpA family protein disulfide reductase n=1 Tax=Pedobacter helvus TaxID=2563444 RepID=A0ABW9JM29_9SPHI|nr:thioredoxin-like domain-containing protein [Pedobacter ureilyticus]
MLRAEDIRTEDVVIEGRITDDMTKLPKGKQLQVSILISEFPTSGTSFPGKKYMPRIDQLTGHFRQIITAPAKRFYMYLLLEPVEEKKSSWSFIDNVYILDAGDRITCQLSSRYFNFQGRGSAKLQCQSEIYSKKLISSRKGREQADSLLKVRLAIVQKYAPKMGQEITGMLTANCYGMKDYLWLREGTIVAKHSRAGYENFVKSARFLNLDIGMLNQMPNTWILGSPLYCDFLYEKIAVESNVVNDWKMDRSVERSDFIHDSILKNYSGMIREKLLTIYFIKNRLAYRFLNEDIPFITDSRYLKMIGEIHGTSRKDIPFYPFHLENDKGKMVKLSDFDDKVLVIDFWFTGCTGCKLLNEAMSPVVEKYHNDPRVEFISIAIDAKKSSWLRSVSSGHYTHKESIKLYAGREGTSSSAHPLIEYYKIKVYPKLFIVRKGKMFDANPPIPTLPAKLGQQSSNTEAFLSQLEAAIR